MKPKIGKEGEMKCVFTILPVEIKIRIIFVKAILQYLSAVLKVFLSSDSVIPLLGTYP